MVNINLLPPQIKLKIKRNKQVANIFSICLVIVIGVGVLGVIFSSVKATLLEPKLNSLKEQIKEAGINLGTFGELENQALFLNDRAKLASSIEEKRPVWSYIIQDLINSVPQDVQFVSLTADIDKTPNFVLQGNTTSEREIIKFKEKLENSQFFKDVAFKSSSTTASTTSTEKKEESKLSFELEFNLENLSVPSQENKEVK